MNKSKKKEQSASDSRSKSPKPERKGAKSPMKSNQWETESWVPPKYMFIKPKDGEKVPVDDNFSGQGREADGKTNPALWEVYRDVKLNYYSCYLECKV